jgi:hypothetical protein
MNVVRLIFVFLLVLVVGSARAQEGGSRPAPPPTDDPVLNRLRSGAGKKGTTVNEKQAADLTLTVSATSMRPIQTWVRTAGVIDKNHKTLTATLSGSEAALVQVGQRVRAFPPSSKASMYQAFVTKVTRQGSGAVVEASLASTGRQDSPLYVMEIVVERGPFLSVPNEAIIEEGARRVVYVQRGDQYLPQDIQAGIQGELYTQVLGGLADGDQVATFGSFFIDAEHKLKGIEQPPAAERR